MASEKTLVLYFSYSGTAKKYAELAAKITGGDLFRIEPVKSYPSEYRPCTDVAAQEKRENARPAVKRMPDLSKYDKIVLGYPCWWGTLPMPVFTVLDGQNTVGKLIAPFCTNGGSGMGSSETDLKKLCTGARIASGLPIGDGRGAAEADIAKWLRSAGII
jgi:flavodoxin